MKLTELIQQLQEMRQKHGDVDVTLRFAEDGLAAYEGEIRRVVFRSKAETDTRFAQESEPIDRVVISSPVAFD